MSPLLLKHIVNTFKKMYFSALHCSPPRRSRRAPGDRSTFYYRSGGSIFAPWGAVLPPLDVILERFWLILDKCSADFGSVLDMCCFDWSFFLSSTSPWSFQPCLSGLRGAIRRPRRGAACQTHVGVCGFPLPKPSPAGRANRRAGRGLDLFGLLFDVQKVNTKY